MEIGPKGRADHVGLMRGVGGDEAFGIDIAAVEQVRAGEEVTRGQVSVDGRAHHAIRHGRGRCAHLGDEMRLAVITGLGQVDCVAHPLDAPLRTVPRLWAVGGSDHLGGRVPLLHRTSARRTQRVGVLLRPDLPQRLNGWNLLEPGQVRRGRQRHTGCGRVGEMVVLDAGAIAVEPLGRRVGSQPVRGHQHMRRVCALAATHFQEAARTYLGQPRLEAQRFRLSGDQPGPEVAQHRVIEAGISQLQAQGLLPSNATAHGVGGLAVGQASANGITVVNASRQGASAGCPRAGRAEDARRLLDPTAHQIMDCVNS
jgi:hypothetical protein